MAYRRPQADDVWTSRWRIKHRAELVARGIPSDIASEDRRWSYVLLHGDDLESGWSESWLTEEKATRLLAFLEPHVPNSIGIDLVAALRRRRGRG